MNRNWFYIGASMTVAVFETPDTPSRMLSKCLTYPEKLSNFESQLK